MADLTYKQRAFVNHYIQCGNATEAAARAGYSGDRATLAVVGSRNLRNDKIKRYIKKHFEAMEMETEEIKALLARQARGAMSSFIRTDVGPQGMIDLKKAKEDGVLGLATKVRYTRGALEVEVCDPQRATEFLAKMAGLVPPERHEHSGPGGGPIRVKAEDLSDDELASIAAGGSPGAAES